MRLGTENMFRSGAPFPPPHTGISNYASLIYRLETSTFLGRQFLSALPRQRQTGWVRVTNKGGYELLKRRVRVTKKGGYELLKREDTSY